MITAKNALDLTYDAVHEKVEQLMHLCNEKIIMAAEQGLRGANIKFTWNDYSFNVCTFVVEKLKEQGFKVELEQHGIEDKWIVIYW